MEIRIIKRHDFNIENKNLRVSFLRKIETDIVDAAEKIIGDGSAMDALKNEIATGLPTNGIWHDDKLMQQKASLENLLNNKRVVTHDPITRRKLKKTEQYTIVLSAKDQSVARALIEEINTVLNQIPASGLNKKVL